MTKPKDSAKKVLDKHRGVVPVKCKICRITTVGYAEHEAVNLTICKYCSIWLNREIWKQKRFPRQ